MANDTHGVAKKPPLGLVPRLIRDSERQTEIVDAMNRYIDGKMRIPDEWFDELQDIQYRLYPDEIG